MRSRLRRCAKHFFYLSAFVVNNKTDSLEQAWLQLPDAAEALYMSGSFFHYSAGWGLLRLEELHVEARTLPELDTS